MAVDTKTAERSSNGNTSVCRVGSLRFHWKPQLQRWTRLVQGQLRYIKEGDIEYRDRVLRAADLAERENLSDQIAGVGLATETTEVTDILLDLTRRETQAFSVTMANSVVDSFKGQVELISNPHRYAGFRVLQAHDVPSILLELGFLSNKDDEKLLLDEAWRTKVADLLTTAVLRYRNPVIANGG